ncbi:MAG TPA: alpha/beta hydrolase, partial [Myxococcota bacterium]|nr:alpha/beta hydrolase [Myxococcota bacterium]
GPMRDVSAEIWRKQFDQAAKEANRLAKKDGLPLYFMGFSLGALVGLEWLAQSDNDGPKIERMVLVAPALATPWYSKTVLLMFTIFGKGFSLPSRSPKEYRANNGSSLAAYKALFDLINSLKSHNYKNANIPSLVVMDKHDELVPYKAIKQIISERHLGQWKLDIVDNKVAEQNYGFRHLLVDRQSVGQTLFLDIIAKVKQHLRL